MNDKIRVTAVVDSYRKGGVIDTTVDEILASARLHSHRAACGDVGRREEQR
jgi:hypothetical protein